MKKILIFLWLFFVSALQCDEFSFRLLAIPRSGHRVTMRALHLIEDFRKEEAYYQALLQFPASRVEGKLIVNVRDLRDVFVSMVHQMRNNRFGFGHKVSWFHTLSFEEQLSYLLSEETPLSGAIRDCMRMIEDRDVLVVRYEDFVRDAEGAIEKIANFLEIPLTSARINEIAGLLFEESSLGSFREEIGSWKESFNEEHRALFKAKFNSNLVTLGYENDDCW